ncbi:MAG: TonB-dependent receptor [Candidatus Solibacter usitatus]|nr:TonB-dependent receptor [Candidatus Solibacter usitatus]
MAVCSLGAAYQIYDPATTAASGALFARQPFSGNLIPANRFDPVARNILRYYPLPNVTGVRGQSNYAASATGVDEAGTQMIRVDHAQGANHRLYASLLRSSSLTVDADLLGSKATGERQEIGNYTATLNDSIVIRPNLLAEVRYSVFRYYSPIRSASSGLDASSLGFPSSLVNRLDASLASLPQMDMSGYASLGSAQTGQIVPWTLAATNHAGSGGITWVRGAHTIRAGGEFRADLQNYYNYGNIMPSFGFTGQWTNGPLSSAAVAPVGQSLAGLLLGLPNSGQNRIVSPTSIVSKFAAGYFHDDWKVTRRLTLNAGIRYELEVPETERYNRMNRAFDFDSPNPVEAAAKRAYATAPIPEVSAASFEAKGGFRFAGVAGEPRSIYDADTNNFLPRIGVAFQPSAKTVLRAGYGIYFTLIGLVAPLQQGFTATTPVQVSNDNGLSFRASLSNPFPDGIREPSGAALGLRTFLGQTSDVIVPRKNGYMQRWSFSLQRELRGRFLLEAGYIGNKNIGEQGLEQYNPVPNRYLSTSPFRDQAVINNLSAQVANPFFGMPEFAGTTLQSRTIARRQLLRPMPHFVGITGTAGKSFAWYHAGYVRVDRRLARGFSIQGSYTWSKLMEALTKLNQGDAGWEHRISQEDYPHKVVVSGTWELPLKEGRSLVRRVAGGWAVQGVYQYQVRQPVNFDANLLFNGNFKSISLNASEQSISRWFDIDGFERDAARQPADNLRVFPSRLASVRVPGWNNLDLSLSKSFRVREGLSFQIRAEAQDALNHPVFSSPNVTPTSASFGRITSTPTDDQRRITLSGRLLW